MTKMNFSWIIYDSLAGHEGPSSEQDLVWLKRQGILALLRLIEKDNAEISATQITKLGMWDCHEPVGDYGVPKPEQIDRVIKFIEMSNTAHRPVGISCKFGLGRTGTILACYLVHNGYDANSAIDEVRKKRPGSIETQGQEDAVRSYAHKVGDGNSDIPMTK